MAEVALVERQTAEGRSLVRSLDENDFPVFAALWLYDAEVGHWLLIIGTTLVGELGRHAAYARLQRIMETTGSALAVRDVTLVGEEDRLLLALTSAIQVQDSEVHFTNNMINGILVAEALIYRLTPATEGPTESRKPRRSPKTTARTGAPAGKNARRRAS